MKSRVVKILIAIAVIAAAIGILFCTTRTVAIEIRKDPATPQSPIDKIRTVARLNNIPEEDLLAISAQESSLGKAKVGDSGCSRGWFHINLCANPEAKDLIGDPEQEAAWVVNRLIRYGYRTDRKLAIARYNSPAKPNFAYAELVEKRLKELDLFLAPYEASGGQTPR